VKVSILTLFPEFFDGPLKVSMLGRAVITGLLQVDLVQIRDFALDKHRKVDDRPFGGGPGMVMKPEPVAAAIRSCRQEGSHVVYLSPQGKLLTAKRAAELSKVPHLVLLCGHYEGVDERVLMKEVDEEISIGDYVVTSGCAPAVVVLEAVARFIPGFLGDEESAEQESFQGDVGLDCPHFTRPRVFEGIEAPPELFSGHHKKIAAWRKEQARAKTRRVRPDLINHSY